MVDSAVSKIAEAFKFTLKEGLMIALLVAIFYFTASTNTTVDNMELRYHAEIYEGAESVLVTMQKSEICSPEEILSFLEERPAGKTALKRGVDNETTYELLLATYEPLARNAKVAFNY